MSKQNHSVKAEDLGNRTLRFIISSESVDRGLDSMNVEGVDFGNYAKNPLFLGFHNQKSFPLGIPKSWGVDSRTKEVWMNVYFPTPEELSTSPEYASEHVKTVDMVYHMYRLGMMKAVSIGFSVIDSRFIGKVRKVEKWELHEVSAVAVPMNPDAVLQMKSLGIDLEGVCKMNEETKAGAQFSAANRERMAALHDRMTKACKEMDSCHKEFKSMFEPEEVEQETKPAPPIDAANQDSLPESMTEKKTFDLNKVREILATGQKKE